MLMPAEAILAVIELGTYDAPMQVLDYFSAQHAWGHAAEVYGATEPTTADRLITGLGEADLRRRPNPPANSIAWLLWHMARIEDATMNVLVAGEAQVIEQEGWLGRLQINETDVGTGMTDAEVSQFSERIDPTAILAYRSAVGRRTRAIANRLTSADLDLPCDPVRIGRLSELGALRSSAAWLARAWECRSIGFLLSMPGSGHNFVHIGEAWNVRAILGAGGGR